MHDLRMADRLRETMDGTLGHFWTDLRDVYNLDTSKDGYVRLADDNLFHVDTLRTRQVRDELGRNADSLPQPEAVYAMTGSTRSIFFDIAGVAQNNVWGQRASTETIRSRGVVVNVPFAVLENSDFLAVELEISEVSRWSGLVGINEKIDANKDGNRQYAANTVSGEPLEIEIKRGFKLKLDTTWRVDGPDDNRTVSTPLVVGTSGATPRSWHDHLVPLLSVQDLINLAHEGFVPAERATVDFKCVDDGQPRETPELWSARLMALPRRGGVSRPESMTEVPLFFLQHIGGVRGLRNWIRLDRQHPRATGPITNAYRYGESGVEVHLIEIALGLEYWTRVHKDMGRAWAQPRRLRKKTLEPLPMSIGRYVGPAFTEFVGDLHQWSDRFWNTYNGLKHVPTFEYDPYEVQLLGEAGALLLLGALLNRVAGSRIPMQVICNSHRTHMIGYNTRNLLASGNHPNE